MADAFGESAERIRQIEQKTMAKMRVALISSSEPKLVVYHDI